MRKILPSILILIVLIGTLIPIVKVQANAYDDCVTSRTAQSGGENMGTATAECARLYPSTVTSACDTVTGIGNLICKIQKILNSIIPVLLALGVVYFVWGVVQYMIGDEGEAKKKGKDRIIYGIIGLAVIISVWGLVNIVVTTFGLGGQSVPALTSVSSSSCTRLVDHPKFQDLLAYVTCLIYSSVIPLIFALAVVMFIWGVVQFVINSDEEAKKAKGKQFMLWGIIALTVMVSVWGLVKILGATLGVEYAIPQVKSP